MKRFLHYINLLSISTLGTNTIIPRRILLCLSAIVTTFYSVPVYSQCPTNFTTQPASQTVCVGASVTFTVVADNAPDSYQWYFSGIAITGANSSSYTINPVSLTDQGNYHVELTKAGCTNLVSNVATLTVDPASVGGTTSGAATVCQGSNSGSVTLSGQTGGVVNWQFSTDGGSSWTDISNTSTTQSYSNLNQTTIYRAVVQSGVCAPANSSTTTITVTPNNTITLTSGAGTNTQTVCINTPITNITYSTTGATGATFSGLPAGVTGSWAANVVTISGSPSTTTGSPFTYTVTLTGGCGVVTGTGTITVIPNNTTTLTSGAGINPYTTLIRTPITNITYSTTGATGATVTGLPAGVTGSWAANVVTISGSPSTTTGSPFTYTVTLTGGCGVVTGTGTITVTPRPTVTAPATVCKKSKTKSKE